MVAAHRLSPSQPLLPAPALSTPHQAQLLTVVIVVVVVMVEVVVVIVEVVVVMVEVVVVIVEVVVVMVEVVMVVEMSLKSRFWTYSAHRTPARPRGQ